MTSPGTEAAHGVAGAFVAGGAEICFGVPGGGPNLELVGACRRAGMRFVLAHSETAACIMASTYGYVRGTVAPAIVTRGPGAASAVNGAAQATLDRFPLVIITDTVPMTHADRVPHQRIDQRSMFEPVTKATAVVGAASTQPEVEEWFDVASALPRGAVHFNYDSTAEPTIAAGGRPVVREVDADAAQTVTNLISSARHPVVICGLDASDGGSGLRESLVSFGAPVFTTYQAIGAVDTEHRLNAGLFTNGKSERALLEQADVIITIGLDPIEPIPAAWTYNSPVVSLAAHPTTDDYLPIAAELVGDLEQLALTYLRETQHDWSDEDAATYREATRGELRATDAVDRFGANALVEAVLQSEQRPRLTTVDAGAHFLAIMPFWQVSQPKELLISNGLATMGFAVPAAIGMALAHPGESVLALVGDGGLGMTLAELETIVRLDLPITTVVFNDSALSLIEIKQSSDDGSGGEAVHYSPSDFAQIAVGMGMASHVVSNAGELADAMSQSGGGPRLIDARIDPGDYRHLIRVTRG